MSAIKNYDARWEWFPKPGSVVSVSAFYKDLKDPIEKQIVTFGGGIVGFENRAEAKVYGAEFEARSKLDVLDPILSDFSAGFNFSYILSDVPLTAQEKINDPSSLDPRPLYDQSEWIANADISWDNQRLGHLRDPGLQLGRASHLPRRCGRSRRLRASAHDAGPHGDAEDRQAVEGAGFGRQSAATRNISGPTGISPGSGATRGARAGSGSGSRPRTSTERRGVHQGGWGGPGGR